MIIRATMDFLELLRMDGDVERIVSTLEHVIQLLRQSCFQFTNTLIFVQAFGSCIIVCVRYW